MVSSLRSIAEMERIKKQQLIHWFSALASVVPGSDKMDLISLVEAAEKYTRELEERVKMLELELEEEKPGEAVVNVDKAWGSGGNESSYSCHSLDDPEIEAMAHERSVLIRIHCKQQRSGVSKILGEIGKNHLTVINMCSMPFTDHYMEVTVTAQMDENFSMTMEDLMRNLYQALDKE